MKTFLLNNRKKIIIFLVSVILGTLAGVITEKGVFNRLEYMVQDAVYQKPGYIPSDIKIIAVDEKTLSMLGPYTDWNREYFAELINMLLDDGENAPQIIGIDFVFTGTNNSEGDAALVDAIAKADNVVLASSLNFDNHIYVGDDEKYYVYKYVNEESTAYDALNAVSQSAFTNAIFDEDGFVRRSYTHFDSIINGETTSYYSFAYTIARLMGCEEEYPISVQVKYTGNPGDYEAISMADVLDGSVPASYFKNSVVLIGAYQEGMMDAYRVPVDYSKNMYGVEMQANFITAMLNGYILNDMNNILQNSIIALIVFLFALFAFNKRIRMGAPLLAVIIVGYVASVFAVYNIASLKMKIVSPILCLLVTFLIVVMHKYIDMQRKRAGEMQDMLFSMAEAMAEAIEGRTPYNANHTKNVAKRSVEMLDYINKKHRKGETNLHFSRADKRQLYLAAMLHDVGKMDVPLEVMDKSSKLGDSEKPLRDRLRIISLSIENDALAGRITKEEAETKIQKINEFVDKLGLFNCGKPLNEEEWAIVDGIAESVYVDKDGNEIHYLTDEEIANLHIKAGTLSDEERTIMQSHVIYTDKILSHVKFGEHFDRVREMAANHHEVLSGKGYPKGLGEQDLDVMTRILTIMDIYDSLIADDRPYKKAKPIDIAFKILDEEAEFGKIDKTLLEYAKEMYLPEYIDKCAENNK